MSKEFISILAGILVLLILAFVHSLGQSEKVDVYSRFGSGAAGAGRAYQVSKSRFGNFCQKSIAKAGTVQKVGHLAALLDVNLDSLQERIRILGKEDEISAIEILMLKLIGIVGGAAFFLVALVSKNLMIGIFAFVFFAGLFLLPADKINDGIKEREKKIVRELPLFIEQVYMCIEAGAPLQEALRTVAQKAGGVLGELFSKAFVMSGYGGRWEEELYQMALDVNVDPLEDFINDILISHAKGTSINEALRTEVAHINKIVKAQRQEEINALSTRMLIPIVVFFLLPVFAIIFIPPMLQAMELLA